MLSKLFPYIENLEPIPVPLIRQALNEKHSTMLGAERRAVANDLIPEAGDYLEEWDIRRLVLAEMTAQEAMKLIADRKIFLARASFLLPSLLSIFRVREQGDLRSVLLRLDDCCHDFPIVRKASHLKKARREITDGFEVLKKQISDLNKSLDSIGRHIDIEFDIHMAAINEVHENRSDLTSHRSSDRAVTFSDLREILNCLPLACDMVIYNEVQGRERLFTSDNKFKTHIVECIYEISIWLERPPFVTTPGSEFSLACGLLYELASGESEVSLAGAINKFSRSSLREKIDQNERQRRWENSEEGMAEYEADNFTAIKNDIVALREESNFLASVIASKPWTEFEKGQLGKRLLCVLQRLEHAHLRHGPFLVWASQISERDHLESRRRTEEMERNLLDLEIKVGRERRRSEPN
jgi:hypothetical protein